MARTQARLEALQELLDAEVINMQALRKFSHGGVPDRAGLRSLCWKLLLGYLPPAKADWPRILEQQRKLYDAFIADLILNTQDSCGGDDDSSDPLGASGGSGSKWDQYFKENEVLEQIDKDVRRLSPEFSFYQQSTGRRRPISEPLYTRVQRGAAEAAAVGATRDGLASVPRRSTSSTSEVAEGPTENGGSPTDVECHWEVVERILFVYAKLNPGIGYVQGMNEILGPIYYTLASDPDESWSAHAEADCFFCFTHLMSEIRDVFIKTLDDSAMGIGALMNRLLALLKEYRNSIYQALENMQLKPQFYAFRWLTLLLSQEFQLPDVTRLWDSLFASTDRLTFLLYLCCAMLEAVQDTLFEGDFATSLKTLQRFPEHIDVGTILAGADRMAELVEHAKRHEAYLRARSRRR